MFHEHCFGKPPSREHMQLYEEYPSARGYSDKRLNHERFRAVFVLALYQTIVFGSDKARESFLIIPRAHEAWVLKEITSLSQEIFEGVKALRQRGQDVRKLAAYLSRCIKALRVGHLAFQLHGEPERWAAFGLSAKDPLPEWVPARLSVTSRTRQEADPSDVP